MTVLLLNWSTVGELLSNDNVVNKLKYYGWIADDNVIKRNYYGWTADDSVIKLKYCPGELLMTMLLNWSTIQVNCWWQCY